MLCRSTRWLQQQSLYLPPCSNQVCIYFFKDANTRFVMCCRFALQCRANRPISISFSLDKKQIIQLFALDFAHIGIISSSQRQTKRFSSNLDDNDFRYFLFCLQCKRDGTHYFNVSIHIHDHYRFIVSTIELNFPLIKF